MDNNNSNFNIVQNSDGTYSVKGIRLDGEKPSSYTQKPFRIKPGSLGSLSSTPSRRYYGEYFQDESKYDEDVVGLHRLEEGYTADNLRGEVQPWYEQLSRGAAKGSILAATTFVDGIAGTIVGALNVVANSEKIANSDDPLRDIGYSFIANPLSTFLSDINEKAESWLPNYYTKGEQENSWMENIFTSNFIGDKFLKNLGFTIGAAYSGKVNAGIVSKAMGLKGVRDAFKGVVTTSSGKVLNTSSEIAKAYKSGDAFMDGVKLTDDLGRAAKKLKDAEYKLKFIGALTGAMGEARIESVNETKAWENLEVNLTNTKAKEDTQNIVYELWEEHPEWFSLVDTGDGKYRKMITSPEGQAEWEKRAKAIEDKRTNTLKEIAKKKADMANTMFLAETAVLGASNIWQYGRFLTGGYNSGRQFTNLVKGSIKEGFKGNKKALISPIAKAVSNPFAEANEEMSQALISETSGLKYASDINSFYGAKINPIAEEETINWLNAIEDGFNNTYGNAERWEEGFLGFITGAMGIPKIGLRRTSDGKKVPYLNFEGEVWSNVNEAIGLNKEIKSVTDYLNERVQSPEFTNYYQGIIRHNKYQNDMEAALKEGKEFDFKNAEHSQFISDIIMFDKAGRIQDLYDSIEEAGNVTTEDIESIKSLTIDKESGKSIFENKTDEEIITHIRKQAEEAKKKVDKYVEISNNLKSLYGNNIANEHLEELTWMLTQVDDWEQRTSSIVRKIQDIINSKAETIKDKTSIDVSNFNLEKLITNLIEDDNLVDNINQIINDKNLPHEESIARIESLIKEKEIARNSANLKLGRDIQHIRKKARLRREELQKRYNSMSERLDEYTKAQIEEEEINNLLDEVYSLYNRYNKDNKYKELQVEYEELKNKTLQAYREFKNSYGNIPASLEAIENYLYKEVIIPLSVLEGKRGQSIWEKNREAKVRAEHKELTGSLFSQVVALKEILTDEKNQLIDPINTKQIGDSLIDLIKMYSTRAAFISKYSQLANNPELFTQEAQAEMENIVKSIRDKEVNSIIESIKSVNSVKQLREILKKVDPIIEKEVIEAIQNTEDENLKNIVNNYIEIEESFSIIMDIAKSLDQNPESISAINVINDAFLNSETLEEAKTTIADSISVLPKEVGDEILKIMDSYTEQIESVEATKKDKNKPKTTPKKLGNIKNKDLEDDDEEDSNEDEEEEEEDTEEGSLGILGRAGSDDITEDELQKEEGELRPKRKATPDESLQAASDEELRKIIEGKSTLQGAEGSAKEIENVKKLAKLELEKRETPSVHSEDDDSTEGNSEDNSNPVSLSNHLKSWAITQYNINDLKDRKTRKAVLYNDPRVKELIKLGAFDFVDNGKLGDLFNANNDLPIHYISVKTGPLRNNILLAIKVENGISAINPITAQDGNKYQIVGTLGFNKNNEESKDSYNALVDAINNERDDSKSKYFVSNMTNKISHIYSGRMVKSNSDESVKQRPLREVLKGEVPHFGVYYNDRDFRTPTLGDDDIVVPLNGNNNNPRQGSLWLMTKEADGRYYSKHVNIARFNSSYDLEANRETPLVQGIIKALQTIVDPKTSIGDKAVAKRKLESILYFPEGNYIYFKDTGSNEVSVSIVGYKSNIGKGLNPDEKVEELLEALHDDTLDLRFQVRTSKLSNESYVKDLLDSNILTTDILSIHNVNASFDIYLPDLTTGKPIEDDDNTVRGHTGRRGINSEIEGDTIIHNGSRYRVTDENVYKEDKVVINQNTIDEVRFIAKIKAGEVSPIEGNNKLYLGTYSNGQSFGVINYKVITGEELEKLLKKASDKVKREKKNSNADSLFERASIDDDILSGLGYERTSVESEEFEDLEEDETEDFEEEEDPFEDDSPSLDDLLNSIEKEKSKEERVSIKGPSLGDTFNPNTTRSSEELTDNTETFDSLARRNRASLRELGCNTIDDLKSLIDTLDNMPSLESITTEEDFNALIETIKNCR